MLPSPTPFPTATSLPSTTPSPHPTPTPTTVPTPTPTPVDLSSYLPTSADLAIQLPFPTGEFKISNEQSLEASSFVFQDGFVQGQGRTLRNDVRQLEVDSFCAEYNTEDEATSSVEQQRTTMIASANPYSLSQDTGTTVNASHSYLAGGKGKPNGIDRPIGVAWFQTGRVMCFYVVLGVPGTELAPVGAAADAANHVLERLAEASAPTPTPIPGGPDIYDVGQAVTFSDGFSITIESIEDPVVVNGQAVSPRASIVLVAVEVKACAGPSTTGASISPLDFAISLDDNTRADQSYSTIKQPRLDSATLYAGECLQGWVTFERNWKPRPAYIVVDPIGYQMFRVRAQ